MNALFKYNLQVKLYFHVLAQLELCLVRMPNQNLSDDDARHVYEFMRQNDGVK